MKRAVFFLTALLTLLGVDAQVNFKGSWGGTLNVGVELRLVFNIEKNSDGTYSATMDSPDQDTKGIPCSKVEAKDDEL
ncbi:MAG: hypothetical protein II677_02980, partial [Muribaculaceae bacterium]|nr:hypothetical protein [Muribaculaceae bacterium]